MSNYNNYKCAIYQSENGVVIWSNIIIFLCKYRFSVRNRPLQGTYLMLLLTCLLLISGFARNYILLLKYCVQTYVSSRRKQVLTLNIALSTHSNIYAQHNIKFVPTPSTNGQTVQITASPSGHNLLLINQ